MKIGKVFKKLENNSKVESITFPGDVAVVVLKPGFANDGMVRFTCNTAHEANQFIRGAKQIEEVRTAPEMKTVISLMSGQPVQIPADTPLCLDPSSETYWSM